MKKEINIMITLDNMKLISINSLYKAGLIKNGYKTTPYIYKTGEAKKFEAIVHEQLRAVDWTDHIEWITKTKQFNITNQYILKSGIGRRDVSNFTKLSDDTIVKFIKNELKISKFDDRLFVEEHLFKSIIPGGNKEYLCVSLKPSDFNVRFDYIEKPEKIYLHSPYPKGLKTAWSKEKIYDVEPKDYNTDLWLISDPELSPILTSKIIQSLYAHREKGYCIVGVKNDLEKEVFEPIVEGHGNLIVTEQENLLEVIKKLRE